MKTIEAYVMRAIFWLLLSFFSLVVEAQPLSEAGLYRRCYANLTGRPVPRGHAVMRDLKAGKGTALEACQKLIDKALLSDNGPLVYGADNEAKAVLNNINSFHRTWFRANAVDEIQGFSTEISMGAADIYDSTEPALAITRAMFAQSGKYSDVLTLPYGMHAQRVENRALVNSVIGYSINNPGRRFYGNNAGFGANVFNFRSTTGGVDVNPLTTTSIYLTMPFVEIGDLVGIRLKTESFTVPNVELAPLGVSVSGKDVPGLNYSFDFFKTAGGGVLGTPIYFLMNQGQSFSTHANATTKLARRWSDNSLNSFLCLELPTLRESDIRNMVVSSSSTSFRRGSSCVMCHATLDPMAYTMRNQIMVSTDYAPIAAGPRGTPKTSFVMATYRAEMGSVSGWPAEPVDNFHRQTPSGRLFYRSLSGELVDRQVASVSDLGQAMTTTEDYYACAAKRYFRFMTGIEVPLYDRGNPAHAEVNRHLSEKSIQVRNFVEELGRELKRTQSLRQLVKSILQSSYYRDVNYQPSEAP